jgi:hypothetical protein
MLKANEMPIIREKESPLISMDSRISKGSKIILNRGEMERLWQNGTTKGAFLCKLKGIKLKRKELSFKQQ